MKFIKVLMVSLVLVGCASKKEEQEQEVIVPKTPTVIQTVEPMEKPAYHDQIMVGDFSAIAGEYVSKEGETIVINDHGLRDGEEACISCGDLVNYYEGTYAMGIFPKGETEGGYAIVVYPVGVEVVFPVDAGYQVIPTDTTKIRVIYGQDVPMDDEGIYTKK